MNYDESKSNLQSQIENQQIEIDEIQKKIDRLTSVKEAFDSNFKEVFQSAEGQEMANKYKYENLDDWNGSKHDSFMEGYGGLVSDYRTLNEQIQTIYSELTSEIARLQAEIDGKYINLGHLKAGLDNSWLGLTRLMN